MRKRTFAQDAMFTWQNALKLLLAVVVALSLVPVSNIVSPRYAEAFTARTERPAADNANYYSSINPYYAYGLAPTGEADDDGNYVIGNCTWYAWGRAREILGSTPLIGRGNPLGMWEYVQANGTYRTGTQPAVGALCIGKSSSDYHVSVVEAIVDGVVYVSESGWKESDTAPTASTITFHYGPVDQWMGGGVIGYIYLVEKPVNVEAVTEFAKRLYTDVLGRNPDEEGLEVQINALVNGWTPAEIAYNYFNSAEYFAKHETAAQTVERVYHVMFGRDSDEAGKAYWTAMMENGMSVRKVVQGFSQSEEYRIYFGDAGLDASEIMIYSDTADQAWDDEGNLVYEGGNGRDLNEGATAFAKRMYTEVLGRENVVGSQRGIDVAGLNVQAAAIANGMECWQVAVSFFGSEEFANFDKSNYQVVEVAYAAILGRDAEGIKADSKNVAAWAEKLDQNMPRSILVRSFCQSDEFEAICQKYGLTSGMR